MLDLIPPICAIIATFALFPLVGQYYRLQASEYRGELRKLREENYYLKMENEMLKNGNANGK